MKLTRIVPLGLCLVGAVATAMAMPPKPWIKCKRGSMTVDCWSSGCTVCYQLTDSMSYCFNVPRAEGEARCE